MPVNSLSITKRELRKFEGTAESNRIDITGEYEVTIKNEGFLPTLASRYQVEKLSLTSANKVIITEKGAGIGRMSPGATEIVNISFKISGNKNQLMSLARNGCNGNAIQCKIKEKISGALLQVPFDKKQELSVSSGSCSLDSGVDQAPEVPEPTPPEQSQAIQTLTMRFDNEVSPTEVTAGEENSWVINGNNVNEVNQIIVELGDGSTTSTRREIQVQNSENNTQSNLGQVFSHTYTSQGQYTIVAEAINSNGETVGSARYGVTVNPQVTTDPVEPEPTNPGNFNITVDNKNEPVNPGEQMEIDYTVENTSEASGTGNITLNVDGQRADSSTKTVNAGSSTSGTLTATAPQINSSSVIFRPQISAEGVESNTVSPSFEVKQQEDGSEDENGGRQQPDPAELNVQITGTSSPVNIGQDLNVQYRVINTGSQSTNATIDATTSSSNGRQTRVVETVNSGQSITGSLTIPSTAYGTSGNKTVTIQSQGSSAQSTFTVQEAQPDPAELNIGIARITDPVEVNESTNVRYTLSNSGGQTIEANIEASVDGNNNTKSDTQRLEPNDFLTKEMEIPSSFYGSAGTKTLRLSGRNETDTANFEVVDPAPNPAQLNIGIARTSGPVNIGEDLDIEYILRNTGGQSTNANIDATISSANGVQAQAVETVNSGQSIQGELTVPSTAYGTAGEKTVTLQVEGDSTQTDFTVQQQGNNGQQNQSYELPDFNKDGEINDEDVTDAAFNEELQFSDVEEYSRAIGVDDGDGILTPEQAQQINIDAIERVRDASNYYRLPDYNGDGQINQDDYVDAGFDDNIDFDDVEIYAAAIDRDAQDDNDGALTPEQREQFDIAALDRIKENSQNQQAQSFVPKSMGEVADNKF